ncbi:hypothetical protein Hanom_Chr07g00581521 [Helianthus anomalus]
MGDNQKLVSFKSRLNLRLFCKGRVYMHCHVHKPNEYELLNSTWFVFLNSSWPINICFLY